MATFALFDEVVKFIFVPSSSGLTSGPLDFDTDTFAIALTNTAIGTSEQSTYDYLNDVTQIANGAGYTTVTNASSEHRANNATFAETGAGTGIWQFTTDDVVFTSSGSFGQFRYPVLCSQSTTDASNNPVLIGFLDYGSAVDLTSGNTFTVNVGTNGWFQLTVPNFA